MAWTLVGASGINVPDDGTNHDYSLPGTPADDDVVIYGMSSDAAISLTVVTTGYTEFDDVGVSNPGYAWGYKQLGASPDSVITLNQASSAEYAAGVIQIWRPADGTTPIDDTPTSATGASGAPDPPSFDTVTDGALVIVLGFLDDQNVASAVVAPSGYTNLTAHDNSSNADNATTMIASFEKASAGTENPGAFSGTGVTDEWRAVTFALRPAAGGGSVIPVIMHHRRQQGMS